MKKNILKIFLLIVTLLFSYNNAFGSECSSSCTIKDSTADFLMEYIENNRKIINNISGKLKKGEKKPWYYFKKENTKIYNLFTNWSDTYTTWEYFVSQIQAEIPQPIQRDLRLLKNEGESLNRFLKRVLEEGYEENIKGDICEGVSYCPEEFKGENHHLPTVIGKLVGNNGNIINLYQNSILGKPISTTTIFGSRKLILVNKQFKSDINNFYNKYSIYECSKCDGAFVDRIKKSWNRFILNTKDGEDGINEWKNAWALLRDSHSNSTEIQKKERELLSAELSRQGVSGSNAEAILKNLDDFNNNGYSNGNNPIENTFNTFINSFDSSGAKRVISEFAETVSKIYNGATDNSSVSIREFSNTKKSIENSDQIIREIDLLYQKQIPFISAHNLNAEKLRAKIIKMHASLINSINILDEQIPKAVKLCNQQGKGQGDCFVKK